MSNYLNYLNRLQSICSKKKINLIEIGKAHDLPMYKVILNPESSKTVVYSAGIHGEEIAGPWAILYFLSQFNPSDYKKIRIDLFPVASPIAFDKGMHNLKEDPNYLFCRKRLANENRVLLNNLEKKRIFFFHALHEDINEKSFYLYNFERKKERIYREIIEFAKQYFPINSSNRIYSDNALEGIVANSPDGSFEDRMFREGVPYSMCTETPGKGSFEKRVRLNAQIMNKVLDFVKRN